MKTLVTTPLSNTIWYATVNEKTHTMNTNTRVDVTDAAIAAVFEWFMNNMGDSVEYAICYPDTGYELVMRKKEEKNYENATKQEEVDT